MFQKYSKKVSHAVFFLVNIHTHEQQIYWEYNNMLSADNHPKFQEKLFTEYFGTDISDYCIISFMIEVSII